MRLNGDTTAVETVQLKILFYGTTYSFNTSGSLAIRLCLLIAIDTLEYYRMQVDKVQYYSASSMET